MVEITPAIDRALRKAHRLSTVTVAVPIMPVRDQQMPPYRYQDSPMGGGWCSSDGRSGSYTYGKKP